MDRSNDTYSTCIFKKIIKKEDKLHPKCSFQQITSNICRIKRHRKSYTVFCVLSVRLSSICQNLLPHIIFQKNRVTNTGTQKNNRNKNKNKCHLKGYIHPVSFYLWQLTWSETSLLIEQYRSGAIRPFDREDWSKT